MTLLSKSTMHAAAVFIAFGLETRPWLRRLLCEVGYREN